MLYSLGIAALGFGDWQSNHINMIKSLLSRSQSLQIEDYVINKIEILDEEMLLDDSINTGHYGFTVKLWLR